MNIVFQSILQMSFKASFVIIAVLVARLLLRKAPLKYSYMLWAIVALRLCCPVLPQSPVSFFSLEPVKEAESYADAVISEVDTAPHASDAFTPIPETRPEDSIIYPVKIEVFKKPDITLDFIPYIWAIIAVVMLAHGAMTYAKLYKNMADATLLEENVMCSARVPSPFILGFVKPRIYIPYGLEGDALGYVLNHERYHISRGDHILRPVSYLLLCIHWFNPLVWLAFYLMGRDMEMSCDEAVMARYPRGGAAYSETLLSFAAPRIFAVTPCLSESDVGRRIRHILSWKKPTLWVTAAAVMLCIAACALFVFDGNGSDDPPIKIDPNTQFPYAAEYALDSSTVWEHPENHYIRQVTRAAVTTDGNLYVTIPIDFDFLTYVSRLHPLDIAQTIDSELIAQQIGTVKEAWYCTDGAVHYYFIHSENGKNYLARGTKGSTDIIYGLEPVTATSNDTGAVYELSASHWMGTTAEHIETLTPGPKNIISAFKTDEYTEKGEIKYSSLGYAVFENHNGYVRMKDCRSYKCDAENTVLFADDPIEMDGSLFDAVIYSGNSEFKRAEWHSDGNILYPFDLAENGFTLHEREQGTKRTLICRSMDGNTVEIAPTSRKTDREYIVMSYEDEKYNLPWISNSETKPIDMPLHIGLRDAYLPTVTTYGDSVILILEPGWTAFALTVNEHMRQAISGNASSGTDLNNYHNLSRENGVFELTIERGDSGKQERAICCISRDDGNYWFCVDFMRPLKTLKDSPANMGRALFEYDGKTYDLALRENSVNALGKTTEIGKYVLVEGHIGPSSSYYGLFNTKTGEFEGDILANCIGWNKNDATTIIFSTGDGVYDLSGRRIALIPLVEGKGEYISELDYIEGTTEIGVRIANTFGEDTEVIRLALADNPLSPTNVEMVKAAEKAISERYLSNADAPCLTATYIYSSRGSSVYGFILVQEFEDDSYSSVVRETLEPFMVRFDENMNVLEYTSPSADGYDFRDKMATGRHAEELSMLMESFDSAPGRYRILLEAEIQMQIEAAE